MASETKNILYKLFGWGSKNPLPKNQALDLEDIIGLGLDTGTSVESSYFDRMKLPYIREDMYRLYDELDELAEIAGVLWAYAEDATQKDIETEMPVWIESQNNKIVEILQELFYTTLDIEDWLLPATRETGKYGDEFARLKLDKERGVIGIEGWPFPHNVTRLENTDGMLVGFFDREDALQGREGLMTSKVEDTILKPWEVVHFRIRGHNRMPFNNERWVYGTSMLFPVRRVGRRMLMYSDLLFLYRLRNSFDRRVYYVDVGNEDMQQVMTILKRWRRAIEKREYINEQELLYRVTNNPMSLGEQTFWPKRPGSNSSVDVIPGNANVADMADIDREENALFAGLRAPKEYFGFGREGGIFDRDKGLTLKDMRWGRSVNSLQRAMRTGLQRMASIHLAMIGIDPMEKENTFTIGMVPPSTLEFIQNLESSSTLAQLAQTYYDVGVNLNLNPDKWRDHVLAKFLGLNKETIADFTSENPTEPGEPVDEPASTPLEEKVAHKINRANRGALPNRDAAVRQWLATPEAKKVIDDLLEGFKAPRDD